MNRRKLITLLGGASVAWPLAARAQPAMPVIGILALRHPTMARNFIGSFRQGLQEAGYAEGKNVTIDFRSAENVYDRLPGIVAEFVSQARRGYRGSRAVNAALAAKAATKTIPIVFMIGSDPVEHKLVANSGRPEANITGADALEMLIGAKRLELFRELLPQTRESVGLLVNPGNPNGAMEHKGNPENSLRLWNLAVQIAPVRAEPDLEPALASMVRSNYHRLFSPTDHLHHQPLSSTRSDWRLATKLAAIYGRRDGHGRRRIGKLWREVSPTGIA